MLSQHVDENKELKLRPRSTICVDCQQPNTSYHGHLVSRHDTPPSPQPPPPPPLLPATYNPSPCIYHTRPPPIFLAASDPTPYIYRAITICLPLFPPYSRPPPTPTGCYDEGGTFAPRLHLVWLTPRRRHSVANIVGIPVVSFMSLLICVSVGCSLYPSAIG